MAEEKSGKIIKAAIDKKRCENCELPKKKGKNGDICACDILRNLPSCESDAKEEPNVYLLAYDR